MELLLKVGNVFDSKKMYKFLVLLGLYHSPSLELQKLSDRLILGLTMSMVVEQSSKRIKKENKQEEK